jgi:hypothetical protein
MQLIVRSLTTHVLDVSPDANVEVAVLVFIFISIMFYLCCVSGMFIPELFYFLNAEEKKFGPVFKKL